MQQQEIWVSLSPSLPLPHTYIVHSSWCLFSMAGDTSRLSFLKSLPDADTRLVLFQADIYNPQEFEPAIDGCEFVFHVATPMVHNPQSTQVSDHHQFSSSYRISLESLNYSHLSA